MNSPVDNFNRALYYNHNIFRLLDETIVQVVRIYKIKWIHNKLFV
jgi:hypothetical protein